jgi:hypothetical protein
VSDPPAWRRPWAPHLVQQGIDGLAEPEPPEDLIDRMRAATARWHQ